MLGRKKSPDHRAFDLSEKSSHSAASIALAPDSHCCQLRCVRCTKAEASAVESPADSRACRISDGVGLEVISRTVTVDEILFAMRFIGFYQLIEGLIPSILIAMNKRILLGYKLVQMMTFLTVFSVLSGLHDLLRFVGGLRCATHNLTIANNVRVCKSYFASNENNFARAA